MGNIRYHLLSHLNNLGWMPQKYAGKPDTVTITAVGDLVAPKTPTNVIASNGTERIKVEWDKVTKNADDSDCNDLSHYNVYYSSSSGIDTSNDSTYDGIETRDTLTWSQEVSAGNTKYYVATAEDQTGNESSASSETSATSQAVSITLTLSDYVDNFDNVLVGDGIIGLVFRRPSSTWNGFSHYKLYRDENSGSSWTSIYEGPNPAYIDKGLSTSTAYKYKLTLIDIDGNETDGTVRDNSSSGYTPNNSDNSNLTGNTFLAQNIVAVDEVRGADIYAGSSIEIGSSGEIYSSKTSYLDTTAGWWIGNDSGTAKLNIGDSSNYLKWDGSTLDIRGSLNANDISAGSLSISYITGEGALAHQDDVRASSSEIYIDASLQVTGNIYCASNNVQLGQNVGPNNIDGISVQSGGKIEVTDNSGDVIFDSSGDFYAKTFYPNTQIHSGVPTTSTGHTYDVSNITGNNRHYMCIIRVDWEDSSGFSRTIFREGTSVGFDPATADTRGANTIEVESGHPIGYIVTVTDPSGRFTWRTPDAVDIDIRIKTLVPLY